MRSNSVNGARKGIRAMQSTWVKASIWTIAVVAILVSGSAMAESRFCATATLDEPFVMPDGSEHAPGKLTLCRGVDYTPSIAVHVGYVNRRPINMLFSDRGLSETRDQTDPYMIFSRNKAGRLQLYGFSIPCPKGMETFLFRT